MISKHIRTHHSKSVQNFAIALLLLSLVVLLPTASASDLRDHPSGPQLLHFKSITTDDDIDISVLVRIKSTPAYPITSVTLTITVYIGNKTLRFNPFHPGVPAYGPVTLAPVAITPNPYFRNEGSATVSFSVPLGRTGYYLFVVNGYDQNGNWIGGVWLDPKEGTGG